MTVSNLGGAIEHWLGFQEKIGRSFLVNEDSLKYPLADYLVNDGDIDVKYISLEKAHPNFSDRLVDVSVFDSTNTKIVNAFELKLAKSVTRYQSEKQRIFDDLMRLHLAAQVASGKCYFIITGKSTNFIRDFRNYPNTGKRFYRKWFAFEMGQSVAFNVASEKNSDYQTTYQTFITKYSGSYQGTSASVLQLPNQITTTCEFVTAFKPTLIPYMIGIWSIV